MPKNAEGTESSSVFSTESTMVKDIIELNPYGIAVFDETGRFVKSNQAYIDLFKQPPPPHVTLFDSAPLKTAGVQKEILKLAEGKTIRLPPFWHNSRDVGEQWPDNPICIGAVTFPLRGEDGSIKNYIAMFEDVTTRVRAEESLKEALKLKSDFMAMVSHELRTPLFGIIASAELVLNDDNLHLPERRVANLQNIMGNADSLVSMVNNILNMTRIEAGKIAIKVERFSLVDVINSSVESLRSLAESSHLFIEQKVSNKLSILSNDKEKIGHIMTNLISNAIKFTDSGTIFVVADIHKEDPAKMTLSVRDTGIGIPQDKLKTIFEHFKQLDSSPIRRHAGIGLGLAIVKAYADLLGGSIEVESEPDKGSTFTVTLPTTLINGDK